MFIVKKIALIGLFFVVILIAGCVQTSPSTEIPDLAYINIFGSGYSNDADPEYEGIKIYVSYYDTHSELILFENVPTNVTIKLHTANYNFTTNNFEKIKLVYENITQINSYKDNILIPYEDIIINPQIDEKYGIAEVTIRTLKQGSFFDSEYMITPLYE